MHKINKFISCLLAIHPTMADHIRIIGSSLDPQLFICKEIVDEIVVEKSDIKVSFEALFEVDFLHVFQILQKEFTHKLRTYKHTHLVIINNELVGSYLDFINYVEDHYKHLYSNPNELQRFQDTANSFTEKLLESSCHPLVYLTFSEHAAGEKNTGSSNYGKIIIELFNDICPKACENFLRLCTGNETKGDLKLHYINSPIHRIVPGGWISCGDIIDGSGANSISVFDNDLFEDESFSIHFSSAGIIGYSPKFQDSHTNGSQFFITCGPCDLLNYKMVGFGRVIQGYDVLKSLEKAPLVRERPTPTIFINSTGVIKN